MTGAEKYVSLNERVFDQRKGAYVVKNNVTQGMFDVVVTEAPPTDTVREQNMNLLIEWAKKAPPEMTPHIMLIAMDLSGLPNKDMLMEKLKEIVGVRPGDEDLSEEERKQRIIQTLEQHQKQAQEEAAFEQQLKGFALEKAQLENDLLRAQIDSVRNGDPVDLMRVKVAKAEADIKGSRWAPTLRTGQSSDRRSRCGITSRGLSGKRKERRQHERHEHQRRTVHRRPGPGDSGRCQGDRRGGGGEGGREGQATGGTEG
jgi:hypothetical protein